MYRPKNSELKKNPAGENTMSNTPIPSPHHTTTNFKGSSGKGVNPMQVPNSPGFVGKRITTK